MIPEQMPITVLGAGGWIGAELVTALKRQGRQVIPVDRNTLSDWLAGRDLLGPVIYAIGLTADFRQHPYETVEAHVGVLSQALQRKGLKQLLLLSSTRVYGRSSDTSETAALPCLSSDPSDLYNLSKLLGESLVLQDPRPGLKVVRLSNVVGASQPSSTFIGALFKEAEVCGKVSIKQPAETAKDYVALIDVVKLLPLIAEHGKERLYNLGSGYNTSHAEVGTILANEGISVEFVSKLKCEFNFPSVTIKRLATEFEPPGRIFRHTLINSWLHYAPTI